MTTRRSLAVLAAAAFGFLRARPARAAPARDADPAPDAMLLTIVLKHDETLTLPEIEAKLRAHGWLRDFPPAGVAVVSWYVMMGLGQVVTLRFPPGRLREVNSLVEKEAWGAFRTEFYPTYDYRRLFEELKAQSG